MLGFVLLIYFCLLGLRPCFRFIVRTCSEAGAPQFPYLSATPIISSVVLLLPCGATTVSNPSSDKESPAMPFKEPCILIHESSRNAALWKVQGSDPQVLEHGGRWEQTIPPQELAVEEEVMVAGGGDVAAA